MGRPAPFIYRPGRTRIAPVSKTAVLFPGQGSQTPDMRDAVAARRPDLLELALEVVGDDPFARVDDGTRYAQPAIYCASVASWERLVEGGLRADLLAGHSLGEVAALVAGGATNQAIADALFLSVKTVESHLRNIFAKTGVTSRVELARLPLAS